MCISTKSLSNQNASLSPNGAATSSTTTEDPPKNNASGEHPYFQVLELITAAARKINPADFLQIQQWVLVDEGNLAGCFGGMPRHLRVGPWHPLAPVLLTVLVYFAIAGSALAWQQSSIPTLPYPPPNSAWWWYSLVGLVWITAVAGNFYRKHGWIPWTSYSLFSWTLLSLRYGLTVLAPWLETDSILWNILELTRFPILIMCSTTFAVWNFLLMPFICVYYADNAKERHELLSFFARFSLIQFHFFNVLFAYINVAFVSPYRPLIFADFMAAWSLGVLYLLFYLCILDRVGIHYYPILSPRSRYVGLLWLVLVAIYAGGFLGWNAIIEQQEQHLAASTLYREM